MARKVRDYTINSGTAETNRDYGKTFRITEMSAAAAEEWAVDAIQGLTRAGVELPDDVKEAGIVGIAVLGFKALSGIPTDVLRSLMDRMMACVQIKEPALVRSLTEDDIEEVATRLKLRQEVFELHVNFSVAGFQTMLAQKSAGLLT